MADAEAMERLAGLLRVSATATELLSQEDLTPQEKDRLEAVARMIEAAASEMNEIATDVLSTERLRKAN